jgi:DNA polymerase-4
VKEHRRILHVDLDPFLVSVERSLNPAFKDLPVIVGGDARSQAGIVAAASAEARKKGVKPGQPLIEARRLCPEAVVRPGDLETYARVGEEVTEVLLAASRRVERPSSDEAYLDLSAEKNPVALAEGIKDSIQRRLGLDASLGLASSRLAARVASRCARPRGFLVVLPGYETSFLARQPLSALPDLPPHLEAFLEEGGFSTVGDVAEADPAALAAAVGALPAPHLQRVARGEGEDPIELASAPPFLQADATIRDPNTDREALGAVLEALVARVCRRLWPLKLQARSVTVEVRGSFGERKRSENVDPGFDDAEVAERIARSLAEPLLTSPRAVRSLHVRLSRLTAPTSQTPLFPTGRSLERGRRASV